MTERLELLVLLWLLVHGRATVAKTAGELQALLQGVPESEKQLQTTMDGLRRARLVAMDARSMQLTPEGTKRAAAWFVQIGGRRRGGATWRDVLQRHLTPWLVGRWLAGGPGTADRDDAPPTSRPQRGGAPRSLAHSGASKAQRLPDDLPSFAQQVLDAARASKTGRFGDDKVFISHVYRQLNPSLGLDAFKNRLVEAHRKGLLSLSRADLVEAMDPRDVEESEAAYMNATFHFVRLPQEPRRW